MAVWYGAYAGVYMARYRGKDAYDKVIGDIIKRLNAHEPEDRQYYVYDVVGALAWGGRIKEADALIETISEPISQTETRAYMAGILARLGHTARARRLMDIVETQAFSRALQISGDPDTAIAFYNNQASAYAALGEHEKAEHCLRICPKAGDLSWAYGNLIESYAKAGKIEQAGKALRTAAEVQDASEDKEYSYYVWMELARGRGAGGWLDGADAWAMARPTPADCAGAYIGFCARGDPARPQPAAGPQAGPRHATRDTTHDATRFVSQRVRVVRRGSRTR